MVTPKKNHLNPQPQPFGHVEAGVLQVAPLKRGIAQGPDHDPWLGISSQLPREPIGVASRWLGVTTCGVR